MTSTLYNDVRYEYGFTTKYVQTSIALPFVSQTTYFVDPVNSFKILLNNTDITSVFQGSLYYAFKQPMEHSLSIPAKNIYMYSFGLNPKEYNAGGYINFSKLNSQTTTLQIVLNQQYATQVFQGYNLYLFYYATLSSSSRGEVVVCRLCNFVKSAGLGSSFLCNCTCSIIPLVMHHRIKFS